MQSHEMLEMPSHPSRHPVAPLHNTDKGGHAMSHDTVILKLIGGTLHKMLGGGEYSKQVLFDAAWSASATAVI